MTELSTSDKESINCSLCTTLSLSEANYCTHCGYPVGGDRDTKELFESYYKVKRGDLESAIATTRKATKTLFIIAVVILVYNTVLGLGANNKAIIAGGIITAIVFTGLALWSKTKPFTAIASALLVYITLLLIDAAADPSSIVSGIIIKIIIISYLVSGIKSALEAQHIQEELITKNWNQ